MVRKLILQRLEALGLNMAEVSTALGRNPTYLHQFMKRGVPAELHERERLRLAEILKVPESELRGPSNPLPKRSYSKAEHPSTILRRNLKMMSNSAHNQVDSPIVDGASLYGATDLPVFGTAQGGHGGALLMSSEAVDWVIRPDPLLRVRDGYGMIVSGDSMSPLFESGSIALVNPHRPPRPGDACVFRNHQEDGTVLALIKRLRRSNDSTWFVEQFNPPLQFELSRAEWQVCHPTVGAYFP